MKLSFWQFLGLIAAGVALYYFYNLWWVDQDRATWIDKLNSNVYDSPDELVEKEQKPADPAWP